jgi:hypothetical protein
MLRLQLKMVILAIPFFCGVEGKNKEISYRLLLE